MSEWYQCPNCFKRVTSPNHICYAADPKMRDGIVQSEVAALRAARDAALAEVERAARINAELRRDLTASRDNGSNYAIEVATLKAEVERMRPVVEAAMKEADEAGDWSATLWCAVDTFRASAQKEGE